MKRLIHQFVRLKSNFHIQHNTLVDYHEGSMSFMKQNDLISIVFVLNLLLSTFKIRE